LSVIVVGWLPSLCLHLAPCGVVVGDGRSEMHPSVAVGKTVVWGRVRGSRQLRQNGSILDLGGGEAALSVYRGLCWAYKWEPECRQQWANT